MQMLSKLRNWDQVEKCKERHVKKELLPLSALQAVILTTSPNKYLVIFWYPSGIYFEDLGYLFYQQTFKFTNKWNNDKCKS